MSDFKVALQLDRIETKIEYILHILEAREKEKVREEQKRERDYEILRSISYGGTD